MDFPLQGIRALDLTRLSVVLEGLQQGRMLFDALVSLEKGFIDA